MEQSGPAALCELLSRGKSYRDGPAGSLICCLLRKSAMEAEAGAGAGERELLAEPRWIPNPEAAGGGGDSSSSSERESVSPAGRHLEERRRRFFDDDDDANDEPRVKRGRVERALGGVVRPHSPGGRRRVLAPAGRREEERRRLKRQLEAMRRRIQQLQGRIGRAWHREAEAGMRAGPRRPGAEELGRALKAELSAAVAQAVDAVVKMLGPRPGPPAQVEALPLVVRRRSPPGELGPGPTPGGWPRPLPWQALVGREPGPAQPPGERPGLRTQVSTAHPRTQPGPCPPVTKSESLDLQEGQVYGAGADGLSPGHLKKAKLIFLYSRYPSSNTLKTYFPDVKFNRCITSQLIKWFSNFREFFYIQVEKFARQAQSEGASSSEQLTVNRESDLFRTLNQHYNKSSEFEVPDKFLEVSQTTLQEFFDAIVKGRDSDPSWKKPIYKVISKLDSDVPDLFKCPSSL